MQDALGAIKFLTLWGRFDRLQPKPGEIARRAVYFPFVGMVLGLALSVLNRLMEDYLPSEVLSVSLVAAWALSTGAIHLEDLHRSFARADGSTGFGNEKYTSGILGVIALVLIIQLKVNALEAGGETRNVSLVVAPTVARWSVVILLYGMASTAGRSAVLSGRLPAIHLVVTTFFVLTLTTLIAGTTGLWIALWVSVLALLVRTFGYWRNAQLSQDHLGALVEMSETLSLVAFATL